MCAKVNTGDTSLCDKFPSAVTLANGWLNLYKPSGMSSAKAVYLVKKALGVKKVGHAGTLDPLAQGVLPLAIGEATKVVQYLMDAKKSYEFEICWGSDTDTLDAEGEVVAQSDARPTLVEIKQALSTFTGNLMQVPPKYSALKVNGRRAYELARQGKSVKLSARPIIIDSLEVRDHDHRNGKTTCAVVCSKGTYVRSLAQDIAHHLGCLGHVSALVRTQVGGFYAHDTILLENLEKIVYEKGGICFLRPIESVLDDIPVLEVSQEDKQRCVFGQILVIPKHGFLLKQRVQLHKDGDFFALAESVDKNTLKPIRVFMCQI